MRILLLSFLIFTFSGASQAAAQASIAIINVERIYTSSKAAKSIKSQQDKLSKELEEALKKESKAFEKKQKDFEAKRADMSPSDLKSKAESLQKEFNETRAKLQKQRVELQNALIKAEEKLRKEVIKISGNIAEEKSYDIVLPSQSTIVVNKELDITSEVLKRLDDKLTEITVK